MKTVLNTILNTILNTVLISITLATLSTSANADPKKTIICYNPNDEVTANKLWNIGMSDMVKDNLVKDRKCIILKN